MQRTFKKTAVIGAGAWGTALAYTAGQGGKETVLWTYLEREADAIRETRKSLVAPMGANLLPDNVQVTSSWDDVAGADLVLVVVPSVVMRGVAKSLAEVGLAEDAVVVSCSKGIEKDTNFVMSEILGEVLNCPVGALSGPNHAEDIVLGLPSLTLIGFDDIEIAKAVQQHLNTPFLRIYTTTDVVGMQLGGLPGAVTATFAAVLPGFMVALGIALLYQRYRTISPVQGAMNGLRPVIVALIFVGGFKVMKNALFLGGVLNIGMLDWFSAGIFAACLFVLHKRKISPVAVILGGGVIGGVIRLIFGL